MKKYFKKFNKLIYKIFNLLKYFKYFLYKKILFFRIFKINFKIKKKYFFYF